MKLLFFLIALFSFSAFAQSKETPKDLIEIFSDYGANCIRIRTWVDPTSEEGIYCGKEHTLEIAKRIKNKNLKFLLDFHYSSHWADPEKQTKPKDWHKLDFDSLSKQVYDYTFDVLSALIEQDTYPDIIQIGNEIDYGLLWNDGMVNKAGFNSPENWDKLATLLKSGIKAVKDASGDRDVKIMLHLAQGGNKNFCLNFFEKIIEKGVNFDVIGLSYYPWAAGD